MTDALPNAIDTPKTSSSIATSASPLQSPAHSLHSPSQALQPVARPIHTDSGEQPRSQSSSTTPRRDCRSTSTKATALADSSAATANRSSSETIISTGPPPISKLVTRDRSAKSKKSSVPVSGDTTKSTPTPGATASAPGRSISTDFLIFPVAPSRSETRLNEGSLTKRSSAPGTAAMALGNPVRSVNTTDVNDESALTRWMRPLLEFSTQKTPSEDNDVMPTMPGSKLNESTTRRSSIANSATLPELESVTKAISSNSEIRPILDWLRYGSRTAICTRSLSAWSTNAT